ncbi:MAG: bifunctional UDP-N-acetylglucosamine diphosphorylase/glucosamine-1-phosphate N-acetyltransferase GlmU [Deltaproteobacteria bacterium]|nr:bifunctional UDP-N-acetylglucosamine diphosphorylase/glucosamine-1-phosphate N-acetyltransferase GlmU [Deltaproteobacteria bacterium]
MPRKQLTAFVLAAGLSTRMKSEKQKTLHEVCGRPLIFYPLKALQDAGIHKIIVVVGHKKEELQSSIKKYFKNIIFAPQKKALGTADAVKAGLAKFKGENDILIINGDAPLLRHETLEKLISFHEENRADISLISAEFKTPPAYGRIIRTGHNKVFKIVEEKDASIEEKHIKEVNAGIYCVKSSFLKHAIKNISNKNKKNEFYLTDLVSFSEEAYVYKTSNNLEIFGVNDRKDLELIRSQIQKNINEKHMLNGVTLINSENIYIDNDVEIENDVTIHPNTHLKGKSKISKNTIVESHCFIENSEIGEGCHIKQSSVIEESTLKKNVTVGPMAHLRPLSIVEENARVGNFVELKKTTLGKNSKANHLSYLGDAHIGAHVNIGCGVITCNYDGFQKHKSTVSDGAFIGSDVQLVAPVKIGKNAYVGSGSTITKNVPENDLAIARTRQTNIKGYAKTLKKIKGFQKK